MKSPRGDGGAAVKAQRDCTSGAALRRETVTAAETLVMVEARQSFGMTALSIHAEGARQMAKTTAPLLGFGASGKIGNTQVYSSWRGITYARQLVTPANPRSTEQVKTRSTFSWLSQVWKLSPAELREAFTAAAAGKPFTDRNRFIGLNLAALRAGSDLSDFVFSPGVGGGIPPTSITVTPGSGQLTIAGGAPTPPTGWTITEATAVIEDQDPHTDALYTVKAGTDSSAPYSIVITGLTASSLYRAGIWFKFGKPDGSVAYSVALTGSDTPT
jgi:hypothetical protein